MPGVALLSFVTAAGCLLAGVRLLLPPDPDPRLVDTRARAERRRGLGRYVARLDHVLGAWLQRQMGPRRVARVDKRLLAAGRPGRQAVDDHLGRRATYLAGALVFGLIFALEGTYFILPMAVAAAWLQSNGSLTAAARKRGQLIQSQLPDFLDVTAVMLSAGLSFREALGRVAEAMPGPVADEMDHVLRELDLGVPLPRALRDLRARNQSEAFDKFVTALLQAEELGSPLSEAIIAIATDARREAAQAARQRAARTAPRVSLVLTMIILPATAVLLLAGLFFGAELELDEIFGS